MAGRETQAIILIARDPKTVTFEAFQRNACNVLEQVSTTVCVFSNITSVDRLGTMRQLECGTDFWNRKTGKLRKQ